jgi:low affinity Fe/Cu permease
MRPSKSTSWFTNFAKWTARAAGRPAAFALAVTIVVIWACFGPYYHWSDTHQLVINTSTTIVTFLMVFLIQNTQNRDTEALQVKLDELIRVTEGAHLVLLDLEELDDKQLDKVRATYEKLATKARDDLKHGRDDTGTPDLGDEDEDQALLGNEEPKAKGKKKKKK